MKALKRIVKAEYQTTDGKVFADRGDAAAHQRELTPLEELKALVKKGMSGGTIEPTDDLTAEVAQFILENNHAQRGILPKRAKTVEKGETP